MRLKTSSCVESNEAAFTSPVGSVIRLPMSTRKAYAIGAAREIGCRRRHICGNLPLHLRFGTRSMFMPEHFRVEDVAEMHALMRAHPFAALVSMTPSGLYGTHLPTVLKEEGPCGTIECHLARANPHWKDLAKGEEAMMIFQGADGYITPNWYATKAQTGKAVPTWNYAIVHAYGRPAIMNDKDWLKRHVTELSD